MVVYPPFERDRVVMRLTHRRVLKKSYEVTKRAMSAGGEEPLAMPGHDPTQPPTVVEQTQPRSTYETFDTNSRNDSYE